jgi:predicted XRE-type DNA-binding protein
MGKRRDDTEVTPSSGNVFADLGFDHPEQELMKAKLVRALRAIIKRRHLVQEKAAALMGLEQPDVSALVVGRTGKFSIDRLVRCLDKLIAKLAHCFVCWSRSREFLWEIR